MSSVEAKKFSNINATTAAFTLQGGTYQIAVGPATFGGGNVVLQQLLLDGVTWVPVHTPLTAVGAVTADLPPGQFRVAISLATAVFATVASVPR
jgi:hypothetical protein